MNAIVAFNNLNLEILEYQDTWSLSNKQVAEGFGVSEEAIRSQKARNEFKEGVHFYLLQNATGNAKQTFWTLQCSVNSRVVGKKTLGFHIVDKNGITYVMGKNKTKSIEQAIQDASLPFNLALKTTPNNQHVVFKSNLTLSKDFIACQYGNETYYFGYEEAK